MIMTSEYDSRNYYKKMLDLQEKLRKSEEERIRLEERFRLLDQESRSRHDECMNRLRLRYIEYLEEQRARDERNHKLLGTLDKVDNDLLAMTAKTRRLNTLRKQYEAYLLRTFRGVQATAPAPVGNSTVDSGIITQNEEDATFLTQSLKNEQFNNPNNRFLTQNQSLIRNDIQSGANALPKKENILQDNGRNSQMSYKENRIESPILHSQARLTSAERYLSPYDNPNSVKDITSFSLRRFNPVEDSRLTCPYGSNNVSGNAGMLLNSVRTPDRLRFSDVPDDTPDAWHRINGRPFTVGNTFDRLRSTDVRSKTTRVLEDELQRYIENIKSLHRTAGEEDDELEPDHEQNTSGDLLNFTLSDEGDARHDLLAENKQAVRENQRRMFKETRLPTGVEGIINPASGSTLKTPFDAKEMNEHENLITRVGLGNVAENNEVSKTVSQSLGVTDNKEHEESLAKPAGDLSGHKLFMGKVSEVDQNAFYTVGKLQPWDLQSIEKQVREIQLNRQVGDLEHTDAPVVNHEGPSVDTYSNADDDKVIEETGIAEDHEKVEDQSKEDTINVNQNPPLDNTATLQRLNQEDQVAGVDLHMVTKTDYANENLNEVNYEDKKEEHDDPDQGLNNEESNNLGTFVGNECIQNMNPSDDNLNQFSEQNEQDVDMNTRYEAGAENIAVGAMHGNYLPEENYTNGGDQQGPIEGAHGQSNQDYTYGYDQQYPDPNYENDPNQTYQDYPDQLYGQNPNEFYGDYQNEPSCYSNEPNQPYENNETQGYEGNTNQQAANDPNQHYENNEIQFYDNAGNQRDENGSNEQYAAEQSYQYDSNQIENDRYESYENNRDQSYETYPDQVYEDSNYQPHEANKNDGNSEKPELCDPNQTTSVAEESEVHGADKEELVPESHHIESTHSDVNGDPLEQQKDAHDEPRQLSEVGEVIQESPGHDEQQVGEANVPKKKKDVIQAILDSDTESTIERNVSNTESDFDFN